MVGSPSSSVSRSVQNFPRGDGMNCHSFSPSQLGFRLKKHNGFYDNSHLQYCNGLFSSIRCDGNKKDVMVKAKMKKKLKLLKGLSTNLSMYSQMDICPVDDAGKMFSELSQVLLAQLQQLKEEKKEIKRKRKEGKRKLKALKAKSTKKDSDSPSSSSESSDSEFEEIVDMNRLRSSAPQDTAQAEPSVTNPSGSMWEEMDNMPLERSPAIAEARLDELQQVQVQVGKLNVIDEDHSPSSCNQQCCITSASRAESVNCEKNGESFAKRIDVCMGGKCKKFGAAALLKELERKIGVEGAVVGCNCMGMCKNAPNVRLTNTSNKYLAEGMDKSVRAPKNPLYIGVGLDDVDVIVSNFLGEDRKNVRPE